MNIIKSLLVVTLISMSSVNALAQKAKHQHGEHLSALLTHYTAVKDALAEDDFETARSHMAELRKEVVENDEMKHHNEHSDMHAKHHGAMVEAVNKGQNADDIKELRMAFKDISEHLAMALENQGYDEQTLYIQYCPMAHDGEGATWISDKKPVVNPYMDKKMLTCGNIKETINPES